MTREQLIKEIKAKKSFLCVGLDSDINKIPRHLLKEEDPVFEFNKQIIDATNDLAVAYKPNLAFYECRGVKGLISYEKTIKYLNNLKRKVFIIADCKRGDIGNTSEQYAAAFFNTAEAELQSDAVTVHPYMGEDSVKPFYKFPGKWVIILALTSNKGANDFQYLNVNGNRKLYEQIIIKSTEWGNVENTMYVVGATKSEMLKDIRKLIPNHFLLVPGIGAQGGSLLEVCNFGLNKECSVLVNVSRSVIFASDNTDFAHKARFEAVKIQKEMQHILSVQNII